MVWNFVIAKCPTFAKILPTGSVIWIEFQTVMFFGMESGALLKSGSCIGSFRAIFDEMPKISDEIWKTDRHGWRQKDDDSLSFTMLALRVAPSPVDLVKPPLHVFNFRRFIYRFCRLQTNNQTIARQTSWCPFKVLQYGFCKAGIGLGSIPIPWSRQEHCDGRQLRQSANTEARWDSVTWIKGTPDH